MDGKKHQNMDFEGKLSLGLGFSLLSKRNYFLSGFIVFKYSLKKKIDLFLAALGLHCYAQAFHSCIEWEFLSSSGARASYFGGFSCSKHRI